MRWIDKLYKQKEDGIEPSSACKYIRIIYEFAHFAGAGRDYDGMVEDAARAKSSPPSSSSSSQAVRFRYEDKLEKWFDEMTVKQKLKQNVAREKLIMVKSFFYWNRVHLDLHPPARSRTKFPFAPSREVLRKAFVSTPDRTFRWWILLQSQSGLSEIDILNLDLDASNSDPKAGIVFESIRSQLARGKIPVHVVIPRKKTGITTITCIGEESIAMFERPLPSSSSLLRFWWGPESAGGMMKERPLDPTRAVRRKFESIGERLGNQKLTSHSLRRFFESTLESTGLNQIIVRRFMGHSVGREEAPYSAPPVSRMEKIYEWAYPLLRLFPKKYCSSLGDLEPSDLDSQEMRKEIQAMEEARAFSFFLNPAPFTETSSSPQLLS